MASPPLFVALDAVSAVLTLIVALFFARIWRLTGSALLLLFAVGFGLVGVGYFGVSVSQFDLAAPIGAWDALRIAGQLGGALVLLFAYVSHRVHGSPRPWTVLAWSAAGLSAIGALLFWAMPPFAQSPRLGEALPVLHGLMFLAYVACAVLALPGLLKQPTLDRALVPAAFLAWAATKYTWMVLDLLPQASTERLAPLVYCWRFLAIALLLAAIGLGGGSRRVQHAPP
ncbi:MAG: hypothetical protein LC624_06865 [Halobacteriales archaeon]|nr:hypothetical protein [Halobacteriales archaeon]